ncbi:MAG: type II toxin-antitoxin system VapC family toxin [Actinomycetota bacterium]
MIIPDANLLIYATDLASPRHEASRAWIETVLSNAESVAFSWSALTAYVRVSTNPRIFVEPMPTGDALDYVDEWLARPNATVVHPTHRHSAILRDLLAHVGVGGDLTPDAHLAALAIEHRATLHSADTDFARFPGLRWHNPLA